MKKYLSQCRDLIHNKRLPGGSAFFFFFTFPMSPSFGSEEFQRFCAACYAARRARPTLSVNALRTVLTVAQAGSAISYQELAKQLGHDAGATAHQVAALADGRSGRSGLELLERLPGDRASSRRVVCSADGAVLAGQFLFPTDEPLASPAAVARIRPRILPALETVLRRNPDLTLGSLCAFLYIAEHPEAFAYDGQPIKLITEAIGLHNLPKHLAVLEQGVDGDHQSRLIGFQVNDYDRRVRLPYLTGAGLALQCELIEVLTGQPIEPPRLPLPEALDGLNSPADVHLLGDDDFDDIQWQA